MLFGSKTSPNCIVLAHLYKSILHSSAAFHKKESHCPHLSISWFFYLGLLYPLLATEFENKVTSLSVSPKSGFPFPFCVCIIATKIYIHHLRLQWETCLPAPWATASIYSIEQPRKGIHTASETIGKLVGVGVTSSNSGVDYFLIAWSFFATREHLIMQCHSLQFAQTALPPPLLAVSLGFRLCRSMPCSSVQIVDEGSHDWINFHLKRKVL